MAAQGGPSGRAAVSGMGQELSDCTQGCRSGLSRAWTNLPLTCRATVLVCIVVYVLMLLLGIDPSAVCSGGQVDIAEKQWWRLATAPIFHLGFLHLFINCFSLVTILSSLGGWNYEAQVGTPTAAALIAFYAVGVQLVCLLLEWLSHALSGEDALVPGFLQWNSCALGLSGSIFGVLARASADRGQPLMVCFVHVGPYLFPFVMVLMTSFFFPSVYLLGHLVGVFFGLFVSPDSFKFLSTLLSRVCSATGLSRHGAYKTGGVVLGFDSASAASFRSTGMGGGRTLGSSNRSQTVPPRTTYAGSGQMLESDPLLGPRRPAELPSGAGRFPGQGRPLGQ